MVKILFIVYTFSIPASFCYIQICLREEKLKGTKKKLYKKKTKINGLLLLSLSLSLCLSKSHIETKLELLDLFYYTVTFSRKSVTFLLFVRTRKNLGDRASWLILCERCNFFIAVVVKDLMGMFHSLTRWLFIFLFLFNGFCLSFYFVWVAAKMCLLVKSAMVVLLD